ncbi:MAG: site-specific integrase [Xanthomonadales bacterium]|nr:site-specific integrase [Xanthomonadales bacterium]
MPRTRHLHRAFAQMANSSSASVTPGFREFAETWYQECLPQWRPLHQESVRGVLDKYLLPHFGHWIVGEIRRANILSFRSDLSRMPGRRGNPLGNNRINKIMTFLRQILNEAAVRYELSPAFQGIKPLKVPKADVHPFSLEEVNRIISACRPDFRNYFIVRFFTGMRTGEIHGLRWKNVDLDRGLILIRETLVNGEISQGAKTYDSCRDIPMLPGGAGRHASPAQGDA